MGRNRILRFINSACPCQSLSHPRSFLCLLYSPFRPGKYIAIDCEMVGIAGDPSMRYSTARDKGDESSLARVSVVNYYGCVLLDTFVRQRERVTDWRTAVSGVRESDMVNGVFCCCCFCSLMADCESAKSFSEVQKLVAALLKDRILVGHAVHNDLQVRQIYPLFCKEMINHLNRHYCSLIRII